MVTAQAGWRALVSVADRSSGRGLPAGGEIQSGGVQYRGRGRYGGGCAEIVGRLATCSRLASRPTAFQQASPTLPSPQWTPRRYSVHWRRSRSLSSATRSSSASERSTSSWYAWFRTLRATGRSGSSPLNSWATSSGTVFTARSSCQHHRALSRSAANIAGTWPARLDGRPSRLTPRAAQPALIS
jgi:hypothetical protein